MLPSAPVVMTIVFGGAGRMKYSVIQIAARRSSRNDPYVSARSRQETCEILKRGMKGFGTLAALAVGPPTRARTWDRTRPLRPGSFRLVGLPHESGQFSVEA